LRYMTQWMFCKGWYENVVEEVERGGGGGGGGGVDKIFKNENQTK